MEELALIKSRVNLNRVNLGIALISDLKVIPTWNSVQSFWVTQVNFHFSRPLWGELNTHNWSFNQLELPLDHKRRPNHVWPEMPAYPFVLNLSTNDHIFAKKTNYLIEWLRIINQRLSKIASTLLRISFDVQKTLWKIYKKILRGWEWLKWRVG